MTFHSLINMTLFKAVYGKKPPPLLRLVEEESKVEKVNALIKERNLVLDELRENLNHAQAKIKISVDKNCKELEFLIGDHFCSLIACLNEKLSPQFYGPYEVVEKVGKVAYKIKLPKTAKIHPIF